jgi:uncharacterized membrane protein YhaH (DUF805 family)
MENKYCPNCGALANSAKCEHCGTLIPGAMAPPASRGNVQAGQAENLSLWEYYVKVIKNYANFKGRARRKEYWGFCLFNFIIAIALAFLGGLISGVFGDEEGTLGTVLYYLYALAVCAPSLAVLVRRLHDVGKTGWLWLLMFTIVGVIPVLIWLCTDSQYGENKYGCNPKEA